MCIHRTCAITTLTNRHADEEELRYMEIESKLILKSQREEDEGEGENCSRVKDVLCVEAGS